MNQFSLDLIAIRRASIPDISFIYATCLPGIRHGGKYFKCMPDSLFYKKYRKIIDGILQKPETFVNIACLKEDPDVILGYAIMEENREVGLILHWVFTRPVWRNLGIAKLMLPKDILICTHMTGIGKSLKPREWVYDPFLL